jgi:hypothetical protein
MVGGKTVTMRSTGAGRRARLFGEVPWGYRLSEDRTRLMVDEREQRISAIVRHARCEGMQLAEIANLLNECGVRNRRGQTYTAARVHDLLSRAGGQGVAPPHALRDPVAREPPSGSHPIARLQVPSFARGYAFTDLSLQPWTRIALDRAGFTRLGEMHGQTTRELWEAHGLNGAHVEELALLIATLREQGPGLSGGLADVLDAALANLDEKLRSVLLLRLGGTEHGALALTDTARRCRLGTGEWARKVEKKALAELRVQTGPAFGLTLRELEARVAGGAHLSLERLLRDRRRRGIAPPEWNRAGFYERLLARLAPGLQLPTRA